MKKFRMLVANEPRSYREAFVYALRTRRPNTEVIEAEPADLDRMFERHQPDLVICSRVSQAVERSAPTWVLIYPENQPAVMVCTSGELSVLKNPNLEDLLSVVDRAIALASDDSASRR